MDPRRLELQTLLETLLGTDKVYFQPPASVNMTYPCIVYMRDRMSTQFADNAPYRLKKRYLVTVIDRDPDSPIPAKVAELPETRMTQHYVADGLHHDAFTLYF